jgi:hypothetical protein
MQRVPSPPLRTKKIKKLIFLFFSLNNYFWIHAIEIAFSIISSLMDQIISAFFESFFTFRFAFIKIIHVYFIAKIAEHKIGHNSKPANPNYEL